MRNHPVWQAGYWEWEASLFGALLIALALGAIFESVIAPVAALCVAVGVPLHFWGMYRVYRRNPGPLDTIIGTPVSRRAAMTPRRSAHSHS